MRKHEESLLRARRFSLSCFLVVVLGCFLALGLLTLAPASAQQPNATSDETDGLVAPTSSRAPTPSPAQPSAFADPRADPLTDPLAEEKRFRWTTTGKVYLRYGGIQAPRPTKLLGFGQYNPAGGSYEEYLGLYWEKFKDYPNVTLNLSKELYVKEGLIERDENVKQLFQSYNEPSLETGDFGVDLYELLLGFEASSPKQKTWQGKVRAELDVFELVTRLSENDFGGRLVYANDFDSAAVREAFVSLSRAKVGELRIGIAEGVMRRLDAGASAISAGDDFFGDVSQTPWHLKQLGWEMGNAASDSFPKIQYFAPKFYGVSIGAEWFSNLRSPDHRLKTFSQDSSSLCFPSLFYTDDKKLFEPNLEIGNENFKLFDNKGNPFDDLSFFKDSEGENYDPYLQREILPPLVSDAGCWQRSPTGSSWHEDAHPQVMGGNVVVAYEKDFPKKKFSLAFTTHYGVRSSKAQAIESNEDLIRSFEDDRVSASPSSAMSINRKASVLQHAAGVSMGLTWREYSFFGDVTYLVPSSIALENVGGETLSQEGIGGILWSVGIKAAQLIPHKKGANTKRKKKGTLSLAFSQAFTKDPRYNGGSRETTLLLNLQSLYPITENIALVTGYWYGEAAVSVPFFVTTTEFPDQGVLFYERRLVPNHEVVVGLTMRF